MTDSTSHETVQFKLVPANNDRLANLCGVYDDNIKMLSRLLGVRIHRRGSQFSVTGAGELPATTRNLIRDLYKHSDASFDRWRISDMVERSSEGDAHPKPAASVKLGGANATQNKYLGAIRNHDFTFGVGASGTGKTYLAVACALEALAAGAVSRIVLVRPAVEAGEHLGFLPGDPVQKVNPYVRPLLDALHELSANSQIDDLISSRRIEIAQLAYMRGRTLSNSFVILDEAQNASVMQMKMFLTRIGRGSRCVVTGDESQVDLPAKQESGLSDVLDKIRRVDGCAVVRFAASETMRHPIVGEILKAYKRK